MLKHTAGSALQTPSAVRSVQPGDVVNWVFHFPDDTPDQGKPRPSPVLCVHDGYAVVGSLSASREAHRYADLENVGILTTWIEVTNLVRKSHLKTTCFNRVRLGCLGRRNLLGTLAPQELGRLQYGTLGKLLRGEVDYFEGLQHDAGQIFKPCYFDVNSKTGKIRFNMGKSEKLTCNSAEGACVRG